MSVKFTEEQIRVIKTRDKNILVSAAAGSGKTAVLTERILDRICDSSHPVSLDKILVVTFTEAAAAEMRVRIGDALEERLINAPADSPLFKQKALLPISLITTIDSFCLYLLHNHFEEIDLDPSFRIGDEGEMKLMKKDCLDALMERECRKAEEEFFACADCFDADGSFRKLGEEILALHDFVRSMPFSEDWFEQEMKNALSNEKAWTDEAFMKYLIQYEDAVISDTIKGLQEIIGVCKSPMGPIQYADALRDDLQFFEKLLAADFDKRTLQISAQSFATLGRRKKEMGAEDEELKERVKEFRENSVKKTVRDLQKLYHTVPLKERKKSLKEAGKMLYELLFLTREFELSFQEAKKEAKVIDFSDMEHFALRILLKKTEENTYEKTPVAYFYENFFEEIMVDEYQDSNAVQELILDSISKQDKMSGNRFMVGDVKQSIYRFRLARPEIFLKKYESFPKEGEGKNIRIDLSRNFRSRRSVIDSVNKTFELVMNEQVGGITYDEPAHLYPGLSVEEEGNPSYKTEILCMDREELKEKGEDRYEAEAMLVARRIKELYGTLTVYEKDGKTGRKATYRDMVILLRTATGVDSVFKEVLEAEGIPVFVVSRSGYFQAREIKQVLNFLSVLTNPLQDILLAGVMNSYFGGFHEEELARIRTGAKKGEALYESLGRFKENHKDDELSGKIDGFLAKITDYRKRAEYLSVSELLRELIEENDYFNYVSALPGGEKRRGNLRLLIKRAESYEVTGYFGIADFIRYIEGIKELEVDFGESNLLEETADVVRIMTIHKSKGLEFPVCFLSGMGKQFNTQELKGDIMSDSDLGIGGACYNLVKRQKTATLKQSVIRLKKGIDARGEDLRVLYVAMTRAREKLIITGTIRNPGELPANRRPFYMTELMSAQSFMHLLLPVAKAHPEMFDVRLSGAGEEQFYKEYRKVEKAFLWDNLKQVEPKELFQDYRYPHQSLEGLYVKTTVSELKIAAIEENTGEKPHFESEEYKPVIPQFMKEAEVGGSARGSAYHRVMELMDFSLAGKGEEETEAGLDALKTELVAKQMIDASEYDLVDKRKVMNFLNTPLAKRMKEAGEKDALFLEQPFVLSLSASLLNPDFPEEEKVLIQGVIDVYFEEEDGLVLMDYKTDRVSGEEELKDRYRTQLEYYKLALERLEGKKVKESLIYSFYFEKVIAL